MKIFNFKDWGIQSRLAANAVVLVLGEYQIAIAKFIRGYLSTYKEIR